MIRFVETHVVSLLTSSRHLCFVALIYNNKRGSQDIPRALESFWTCPVMIRLKSELYEILLQSCHGSRWNMNTESKGPIVALLLLLPICLVDGDAAGVQ